MAYGVTEQGFVIKPLADVLAEIEADEKTGFGTSIQSIPQSVFGQINGIFSERVAFLWELAQAVYSAADPDAAIGLQLVRLAALTGTVQKAATSSRAIALCCGTPATGLVAGRVVSVATSGFKFASLADATIAAATAWTNGHVYAIGDVRTSNARIFKALTAGTSGVYAPPAAAVGAVFHDGGVQWRCVGTGTGFVEVEFSAQITGPEQANAGTLTGIETPVAGWSTVYNVVDGYRIGTNLETSAQLRIRREQGLRSQGNATADAIRAKVLAADVRISGCYVFTNDTDSTDGDGLLPHSVEIVLQYTAASPELAALQDTIRAAIFAVVGGGITTNGTISGTVYDAQSVAHTIKFSTAAVVPVYVKILPVVDALLFPVDGVAQIKAAVAAYGDAYYTNGSSVVSAALLAQVFAIPGVLDCPLPLIGLSNPPTVSTTLTNTLRQVPELDTARITVTPS